MPYAYFFTLAIYYFVILVVTALSGVSSYRKNYIEASDEFNFYYVSKVFCGWSFSVDNPEAAALKHKSIFKEFQVSVVCFAHFFFFVRSISFAKMNCNWECLNLMVDV